MIALMVSVLCTAVVAISWAIIIPKTDAQDADAKSDAKALNFWTYRRAVVDYWNANPGATGTIPDGSLTFASGHVRDTAWTHVIAGGQLYVYSTAATPRGTANAIFRHGWQSLNVGLAQAGNTMTSVTGLSSGAAIPAAIPAGAVVVIGK